MRNDYLIKIKYKINNLMQVVLKNGSVKWTENYTQANTNTLKSFKITWQRTKLSLEQNHRNKQATYFDWTTVELSWYQTNFLQNLMIQSDFTDPISIQSKLTISQ